MKRRKPTSAPHSAARSTAGVVRPLVAATRKSMKAATAATPAARPSMTSMMLKALVTASSQRNDSPIAAQDGRNPSLM